MKHAAMLVSSVLLIMLLLTNCAKTPVKPLNLKPLPDYNEQSEAKLYYQLWIEAEKELEECVKRCDPL